MSLGRRPDLTCADIVRLTVFHIREQLAYEVTHSLLSYTSP